MKLLKTKTIAVIGYGNQGNAQANCLKDQKLNVIIGVRKNGASCKKAKKDKFEVFTISEAVQKADIISIQLPDQVQKEVFEKEIQKNLKPGSCLCFSHGFSITFEQIKPPKNIDIILVAPNASGLDLREKFLSEKGVPGGIGVQQDYSKKSNQLALEMAKALRFSKIVKTSFQEETFSDLFAEQTILVGGIIELMKTAYNTLVKKEYNPEVAYLCCVYELKPLIGLIVDMGFEEFYKKISDTAEYGARKIGPKIIGKESKKAMLKALKDIESKKFTKEWLKEHKKGLPKLKQMRKNDSKESIEKVRKKLKL